MKKCIAISVLLFFSALRVALAQSDATSAGVIERAATPQEKIPSVSQVPLIEATAQDSPEDTTVRVLVKDFVFEGNVSIANDDLQSVAARYKQKEVSFRDLKHLCRLLQQFYQLRGLFLVRVVLPAQDIKDGVIRIQMIEGTIGDIQIRGNSRIPTDFIRQRLDAAASSSVNYSRLLKSLILLNEYPSFDVKTTLVKGQKPGTTDVVVDVTEHKRYGVDMHLHNGGPQYVSEEIWGPQLQLYDLVRTGDALTTRGLFGSPAENLRIGGLNYVAPVNRRDTKATMSYSYSDFHARRQISDLGIRGTNQTFSLGVIHPAVRTLATKLDLRAGFSFKDIKNFTLNNPSSHDRLRVVDLGFDHTHKDRFYGRTFWRNTLSLGLPHVLGGLDSNDADASRFGAGGRFAKYSVDVTRVQNLPASAMVVARGAGQLASETLPAAEEFHLGGMGTVRGYPQAEYLGDAGYVLNLELRLPPYGLMERQVPFLHKPLKEFMRTAWFVDHGGAYRKSVMPGEFKDRSMTGIGFGLRFFFNEDTSLDMDWGFPVGGNDTSDGSQSVFYIKLDAKI